MPVEMTKEMMEAILSSIDEAVHAVDDNGVTIFYNHTAAQHDEMKREEVLGRHILDVFPSLTRKTSTLLTVLETKKSILQHVQRYRNRLGKEICTVNSTIPISVEGKLCGAVEISKDYSTIQGLTDKIIELQAAIQAPSCPKASFASITFAHILTVDKRFLAAKHFAKRVAPTHAPVLLYGETGTGKELFVQAIHEASPRRKNPLITQNCAALPESLLEGLLFGTAKGSYTGAVDRAGLFELADGGTLLLDEVNSIPIHLQAKLLRVLEDGIVRRIGAQKAKKVDVRIIAAMNEHPAVCVEKGLLRADLYYRLNVFSIHIPPLRERISDLPILTEYFLKESNLQFHKAVKQLDVAVQQRLLQHSWPGNVRELKHVLEHAVLMADGSTITMEHLPPSFSSAYSPAIKPLRHMLTEMEQLFIEQAMQQTEGNIMQAAKLLHIPRQTLQYKLQKRRGFVPEQL